MIFRLPFNIVAFGCSCLGDWLTYSEKQPNHSAQHFCMGFCICLYTRNTWKSWQFDISSPLKNFYPSIPVQLVPFPKFYQSSLWLSESDNPAVVIQHADHTGHHNFILRIRKNVACLCVNAQILSTYCFFFLFFHYYGLKYEISVGSRA